MRTFIIILDGYGIGESPDANYYGDEGSNTAYHVALAMGGINLVNLGKLGLPLIVDLPGTAVMWPPLAAVGRLRELSAGKDTTTGHWELSGIILTKPFPTFPRGFPNEIIESFKKAIGRDILGNYPASGTMIIEDLGPEHLKTGYPIVYTSADSVFQIAAHEDVVPVETLYEWCRIARNLLQGPNGVARVIARPFAGTPGKFYRTPRRRDFSLPPPKDTLLDKLSMSGYDVITLGKLDDIFANRGITKPIHCSNNDECMEYLKEYQDRDFNGLLFCNLIDFDMKYGHRNDPPGYAKALLKFDDWLVTFIEGMRPTDLLIISADHGNDPLTKSTDHSREYVPLLFYGDMVRPGNFGTCNGFCCLGKTLADIYGVDGRELDGISLAPEVLKRSILHNEE